MIVVQKLKVEMLPASEVLCINIYIHVNVCVCMYVYKYHFTIGKELELSMDLDEYRNPEVRMDA